MPATPFEENVVGGKFIGKYTHRIKYTQLGFVMYFKLTLLTLLFLGWANVAILCLVVNLIISNFGKRIFAGFCAKMVDDYNKVSNPMKIELFKELNDMRRGEKISVLEVGAGPGANFKYFNRDAIQFCRELHFFDARVENAS